MCIRDSLTIEHDWPYAFGGLPTIENCRLLCAGHNAYTARLVFGQEHIGSKIAQARPAKHAARQTAQTALADLDRSGRKRYVPGHARPHAGTSTPVSYTHLRTHETPEHLVCRLLLEKKKT